MASLKTASMTNEDNNQNQLLNIIDNLSQKVKNLTQENKELKIENKKISNENN